MNRKIMLMLVLAALTVAVAAVAADQERDVKVLAFTDDGDGDFKVEIVEENGVAQVKIWRIVDGEDVLVEEYEGDEVPRELEVDGRRILVLGDNARFGHGAAHFGDGEHEILVKRLRKAGHDAWTVGDGEGRAWFGREDGAYLGVQLSDLDDAKAEYFEVKNGAGALVTEIVEDSPAAAAGFEIYDVIVKLGDESIADAEAAVEYVRGREADETVKVTVLRKGKKKTFEATLGERPADRFAFAAPRIHRDMEFFPGDGLRELHEHLAPMHEGYGEDLDNLRADIEELRAMIEELKNNR